MFHSSTKQNLDTMFVILCVIAGATSHDAQNPSKTTSVYKSHNRYKSSFIELLLQSGTELDRISRQSSNELDSQPFWRNSHRTGIQDLLRNRKELTFCAQLSHVLSTNQLRFCQRHYDILVAILPQIVVLSRKECARITKDLRWNCSTWDPFMDRTNSLSFTKEAALIRSIINASMMYLTVKTCFDNKHSSCGCHLHENQVAYSAAHSANIYQSDGYHRTSLDEEMKLNSPADNVALNGPDLTILEAGSPLRLTRSMVRRQACSINIPFADSFTRVFMDADDTRSLNKAYKILNEESLSQNVHTSSPDSRLVDTDQKDLSFIKWTKSAINLHNNHVGRQAVRDAVSRQCRCHGVSGMCQYQTCWDQLSDIEIVSSKLREIYMSQSDIVTPSNLGTYSQPDLYLAKSHVKQAFQFADQIEDNMNASERIGVHDLAYLHQSPSYCNPHPNGGYFGTVGRECSIVSKNTHTFSATQSDLDKPLSRKRSGRDPAEMGACEHLCCDRGIYSELMLDFVECNCRFKFCCRVQCDRCLRQQMRHYCR